MKNFAALILACVLGNAVFAHTINSSNATQRHWSIARENKTVHGAFSMYRDGNVFIVDAQNRITKYPLSFLGKKDQTYAMQQYRWVKELNNKLHAASGAAMTAYGMGAGSLQTPASTTDPAFMDSAFAPFRPNVHTRWDANYFYVESKGIPVHPMMAGIINWQQQVPIPQCYIGSNAWSIPLNPVIAPAPVPVNPQHFIRGAIAVAVNGVPIFNPYTNTGVDAYLTGQLDNWGGHCGRADDYHYHIAPLSLYGQTRATLPVAFGLDGFAVYGSVEPDGTPMSALDANHGHYGSNGAYHYHGTAVAPYMIGRMVGRVTEDSTLQIIPQPHADPVRPALTPLTGAVITNCQPNGTQNGYTLTYALRSQIYSIEYHWTAGGLYTFNFISPTGTTTQTYNGFAQCAVPTSVEEHGATRIVKSTSSLRTYPNPFNPATTIHYTISKTSTVLIRVCDIAGREVSVVVNERQTAGEYTVSYKPDSGFTSSGIMFISLMVDGVVVDTQKVVLVK